METSCGFSVSSKSIRRLTSGSLDFCAATISRLAVLSAQTRTCGAGPPWELALDGGGPLLGGSLTTGEEGPLLMKGGPIIDEELLREEDDDDLTGDEEEDGGAG